MKWIVTDALPPTTLAQPLSQALQSASAHTSQQLSDLSARFVARVEHSPIHEFGCTPGERLLLESLGCPGSSISGSEPAGQSKPVGAFLAALHANITDHSQTVWVAELCSTIISPDRATLITLPWLQASAAHLQALQKAAHDLLGKPGDPIWLEPIGAGRWRVHASFPEHAWLASPAAVQGQDMGDWWPTETHWKAWRRLLNEIQMCWHEHPVNLQRQEASEPEINGLWLYGGGRGWTPRADAQAQWITTLSDAATRGDWQKWLIDYQSVAQQLTEIVRDMDSCNKATLSASKVRSAAEDPGFEIILTGQDRMVHLAPRDSSRNSVWHGRLIHQMAQRVAPRFFRKTEQTQPWSAWWNSV